MSRIFDTDVGLVIFFSVAGIISLLGGLYLGYTW